MSEQLLLLAGRKQDSSKWSSATKRVRSEVQRTGEEGVEFVQQRQLLADPQRLIHTVVQQPKTQVIVNQRGDCGRRIRMP